MARELNLNANFKLSLNDCQIEENAVDEMIEQLTPKSNVMKWILDYINENISEDKSWNVISTNGVINNIQNHLVIFFLVSSFI